MTYLIINASDNFVKKVIIGKFGICEFVEEWKKNIELYDNVFLQTKFKQYLWVRIKNPYTVEINGEIKNVWICQIISTDKLNELTGETVDENDKPEIECIKIIYARCVRSMKLLDVRHRKYIKKQNFSDNEIISIRSVAGSGKTTTLLDLAQKHKKKKILYLAFNKSLITEIKNKIHTKGITNLKPCTFDSLMRTTFIQHNEDPNIVYLKPQTIGTIHPWFEGKAYPIKKYYTNWFNKFCRQLEFDDIIKFCKHHLGKPKDLLITLWKKVLKNEFQTFDSIRKMVVMNNWCKEYIDNKYDMIFIDEAQDFDNLMLRILITDTTIPKLFVGDPKQAIYQWRGCINAFDHLPSHTLHVEFYSTFRLGELACEKIREIFPDCWIMSKSENTTVITYDTEPPESYVYLFRSWRGLLTSAKTLQDIWIYNYNKQIDFIRKLHNKLQFSDLSDDEKKEFEDDLPAFLIKLSRDELDELITNIDNNLVKQKDSKIQLYTIHSYKGLENNNVRIYSDIDHDEEKNLYYVSLTRGKESTIVQQKKKIKKKSVDIFIDTEKIVEVSDEIEPDETYYNLQTYRLKKCRELDIPAYRIFNNKVLNSLLKQKPTSIKELSNIHGVGKKFIENYSSDVLEIIHS